MLASKTFSKMWRKSSLMKMDGGFVDVDISSKSPIDYLNILLNGDVKSLVNCQSLYRTLQSKRDKLLSQVLLFIPGLLKNSLLILKYYYVSIPIIINITISISRPTIISIITIYFKMY